MKDDKYYVVVKQFDSRVPNVPTINMQHYSFFKLDEALRFTEDIFCYASDGIRVEATIQEVLEHDET